MFVIMNEQMIKLREFIAYGGTTHQIFKIKKGAIN